MNSKIDMFDLMILAMELESMEEAILFMAMYDMPMSPEVIRFGQISGVLKDDYFIGWSKQDL